MSEKSGYFQLFARFQHIFMHFLHTKWSFLVQNGPKIGADQQPTEDQGRGQPRHGLPTRQGAHKRLAAAPCQGQCPHERDIRQEL